MTLNVEFAREWVIALRSNEFAQTDSVLRDTNGYCCLGVACEVAARLGLTNGGWVQDDQGMFFFGTEGDADEGHLPNSVAALVGITEEGRFSPNGTHATIRVGDGEFENLVEANDGGESFSTIADAIEAEIARVERGDVER